MVQLSLGNDVTEHLTFPLRSQDKKLLLEVMGSITGPVQANTFKVELPLLLFFALYERKM